MNKQDWIWVGFKLLGVYFVVRGLLCVPTVVRYVISVRNPFGPSVLPDFAVVLAYVALYAIPGFYLLKGGNALLAWITPPEDMPDDVEPSSAE